MKQTLVLIFMSSAISTASFAQGIALEKEKLADRTIAAPLINESAAMARHTPQVSPTATLMSKRIQSSSVAQSGCNPNNSNLTAFQNLFAFDMKLRTQQAEKERVKQERANEVLQDNEYTVTGNESGIFLDNPLMLNGAPLDYGEFTLQSSGDLTVIKKAAGTGEIVQVSFYIYLRRDGVRISLPDADFGKSGQMKVDLFQILKHARPGDQLVIEAVKVEDGAIKRILNLLNEGC